jgi:hypothetical protein
MSALAQLRCAHHGSSTWRTLATAAHHGLRLMALWLAMVHEALAVMPNKPAAPLVSAPGSLRHLVKLASCSQERRRA